MKGLFSKLLLSECLLILVLQLPASAADCKSQDSSPELKCKNVTVAIDQAKAIQNWLINAYQIQSEACDGKIPDASQNEYRLRPVNLITQRGRPKTQGWEVAGFVKVKCVK